MYLDSCLCITGCTLLARTDLPEALYLDYCRAFFEHESLENLTSVMDLNPDELKERMKQIGKICIPGMRLSPANNEFISGPGTHELMGYIYANLSGVLKMTKNEESQSKATIVSVESPTTPSILPKTGDVVTAKVLIVNPRQVQCTIFCVGPSVLARPYRGILKKEEIRATDKDRIDPYKCFRPGDVILARVLPMQEFHWYPLSTAENELGVVIATAEGSPQGVSMIPVSWSEMQCPKSLVKEPRKVARVMPEFLLKKSLPKQENKSMEAEESTQLKQENVITS